MSSEKEKVTVPQDEKVIKNNENKSDDTANTSRSDSRSSSRSSLSRKRSKKDKKSKHKKRKYSSSRSQDRKKKHKRKYSRSRSDSSRRKSKKSKHRSRRSRSRSNRRRRSSSREQQNEERFLSHYRDQIQGVGGRKHMINQKHENAGLFWDGFHWITPDVQQNKQIRSVTIYGLPLDKCKFTNEQFIQFLTVYMMQNKLADAENKKPIAACIVDFKNTTASVEFSSIEECQRFSILNKITILDKECRIVKQHNSNPYNQSQGIESAQTAAKAQAAAMQAMQDLKDDFMAQKKQQYATNNNNGSKPQEQQQQQAQQPVNLQNLPAIPGLAPPMGLPGVNMPSGLLSGNQAQQLGQINQQQQQNFGFGLPPLPQ